VQSQDDFGPGPAHFRKNGPVTVQQTKRKEVFFPEASALALERRHGKRISAAPRTRGTWALWYQGRYPPGPNLELVSGDKGGGNHIPSYKGERKKRGNHRFQR